MSWFDVWCLLLLVYCLLLVRLLRLVFLTFVLCCLLYSILICGVFICYLGGWWFELLIWFWLALCFVCRFVSLVVFVFSSFVGLVVMTFGWTDWISFWVSCLVVLCVICLVLLGCGSLFIAGWFWWLFCWFVFVFGLIVIVCFLVLLLFNCCWVLG